MKTFNYLLLTIAHAVSTYAQNVNATLRGTVKNASGAVIGDATVVVKNAEKGVSRELRTNSSGDYVASQLAPQPCSISVSSTGFKTETYENFALQVGQEARLDFVLQVGSTGDQVTISEVAPLIQSENASVGDVVDEKSIKELPLNGR